MHPLSPAILSVAISLAAQSRTVDEGGKAPVSACEPLCAIFLREPSVWPTFTRESERGPFVGEVEKRLGIKFMVAALPDYSLLLVLRVHREPENVCI